MDLIPLAVHQSRFFLYVYIYNIKGFMNPAVQSGLMRLTSSCDRYMAIQGEAVRVATGVILLTAHLYANK